jgi:hypothetical protein
MTPQQSCQLESQLVPFQISNRESMEGGGRKHMNLGLTDRRLSHSGIFFRGSEILALRLSAERLLVSAAPFRSALGHRNSPRGRCPSEQARWAFHCGRTVGIGRFEIRDLFYEPVISPGGRSQTLERCEPGPVG